MRNQKCRAEWCVAIPIPGSSYCTIHALLPPLHNFETEKDWRKRTNASIRAKQRAAEQAAESDEKLKQRGVQR